MLLGRPLQYIASFSASILIISSFVALFWLSPILGLLESSDSPLGEPITLMDQALINFLLMGGSIFGCLFLGLLIDGFGRRGSLLILSISVLIGWSLILFGKSIIIILIARFILGFSVIISTAIAILYIGEISETEIRGQLSIFCMLAAEIGAVLALVLGPISYNLIAFVGAIITLLFFVIFYFMPESPFYLIKKGRKEEAEVILKKLRGNEDVSEELHNVKDFIEESMKNRGNILDLIKNTKYRKALFIVLGLMSIQNLSGGQAIEANITNIFEIANTRINPNDASLIVIVVPFPFMLLTSILVDRYGRKPLFCISTFGSGLSFLLEALYFLIQDSGADISNIRWMPITGIFFAIIFKSFGIGVVPFLVMGEIFPTNVKGIASTVSMLFGSILGAIVVFLFPLVSAQFGLGVSFFVFSLFCFISFVFAVFYLPETKGRSLAEIQKNL